jgi:hypothetical protein
MSEITNHRTTNVELLNYAKQYDMNVTILMNNEFKYPKNGYYILNLENNGLGGSHWVALICQDRKCFYFDSFGAPPTHHVHIRLKQKYNKIYMNNLIIQDLKSNMCGWFCIALLLYVHLHPKTELLTACNQFINMFDDNTTRNNILLKKYLESIQ